MGWIRIFKTKKEGLEAIPNSSSRLVVIGDMKICLSNFENEFKASEHTCPHRGEELHKGMVNYIGEIICPWHNYRFDLNTGVESSGRCRDLVIYPTKISDEGIFVSLP